MSDFLTRNQLSSCYKSFPVTIVSVRSEEIIQRQKMRALKSFRHISLLLLLLLLLCAVPRSADSATFKGHTDAWQQDLATEEKTLDTTFRAVDCVEPGSANETISVLLLGNSLMSGVKAKLETLLKCGGYSYKIQVHSPGGYYLYQHLENKTSLEYISQGYDFVLLQEQSGAPHTHLDPKNYHVVRDLKSKIENAGSKMGFYQTWAFCSRKPDTTETIIKAYEDLGDKYSVGVVHIGRAWDNIYRHYHEEPPFSLFSDCNHASMHGQSLIAFVLYAYLTGKTPEKLSSLSLSDEDASVLQSFAWKTYVAYGEQHPFCVAPCSADKRPEADLPPQKHTRLRVINQIQGEFKHKTSGTYLKRSYVKVKNVGSTSATNVKIEVVLPSGDRLAMEGPSSLKKYESATFEREGNDLYSRPGRLKVKMSCDNCRR